MIKRIVAGMIGAALLCTLFTACASGSGANNSTPVEQTPKGGYVETDITPPDTNGTPRELWVHDDGSIDYWVTINEGTHIYTQALYHSRDNGANWQQTDLSWASKLEGDLTQLAVTEEGNYFATTQTDKDFAVWQIKKSGSPVRIPLAEMEGTVAGGLSIFPSQIKAVSEDSFFLYCNFYQIGAAIAGSGSTEAQSAQGGTTVKINGFAASNGTGSAESQPTDDDTTVKSYSFAMSDGTGSVGMANEIAGIYNSKGELIKKFENVQGIRKVTLNKQALFCADFAGNVQAVDLTTGSVLPEYSYGAGTKASGENFADLQSFQAVDVDDEGNFYQATNKGIQRMVPGGSLVETLLEGDMFSFGTPTCTVANMCYMNGGSFLLAVQTSSGGGKLYRYDFNASISAVPEHEITVWSLKDSPTVRAAISVFQKKNRDTRVNYEVALTGEETAAGVQDVLRALNTELVAGKGPDVLILDGVDYKSYQGKGVLCDLSKLMEPSDLYESVVKPFMAADGLYVLPTRFSLPLIFGDKNGLNALKGLQDIVSAIEKGAEPKPIDFTSGDFNKPLPAEDRPAFTFSDLRSAFNFFYTVSEPAIIDRSKGIQQEGLELLLLAVKAASDKNSLANPTQGLTTSVSISAVGSTTSSSVLVIEKGLMDFSSGRATFGVGNLSALELVRFATGQSESSPDVILMPGLSTGAYQPAGLAAINVNSKMQKEAQGFITAMLSGEVQGYALGDGLPVTKGGMAQLIAEYNKSSEENKTPKFNISLDALIAQAATPITPNTEVADILFAETERFCKNEATIDEAIQAIMSKTELYLAEKR